MSIENKDRTNLAGSSCLACDAKHADSEVEMIDFYLLGSYGRRLKLA